MARDLNEDDKAELAKLLEEAEAAGTRRAPKQNPKQEKSAAGAVFEAPSGAVAALAPAAPKPVAPTKKKVADEILEQGMRIVCGLTWELTSLGTRLFSENKLSPLTQAEKDEWVKDSMGFARMVPALMAVASVLGFPLWLMRNVEEHLTPKKKQLPKPALVQTTTGSASQATVEGKATQA